MNPDTNKLEQLAVTAAGQLVRPDGSPVPPHWTVFTVGDSVTIRDTTFRVAHVNESCVVLEPAQLPVIGGFRERDEDVRRIERALSDAVPPAGHGDGLVRRAGKRKAGGRRKGRK